MILGTIEFILSPIIWLMELLVGGLRVFTGSAGISILLLSCIVALISYPLRGWANKIETKIRSKKQTVDKQITSHAVGLKGEKRFRVVEEIYKQNDYHPIQSIAMGVSLLVMLPFLLSALFLFTKNESLVGISYLIISDLSKPDGLLMGVNLLPCIMTGITIIDAKIRFSNDKSTFLRFCFIAIVLFVLVYSLSSALVLYWTVSNLISMLTYIAARRSSH